jgi:hypothetical protein
MKIEEIERVVTSPSDRRKFLNGWTQPDLVWLRWHDRQQLHGQELRLNSDHRHRSGHHTYPCDYESRLRPGSISGLEASSRSSAQLPASRLTAGGRWIRCNHDPWPSLWCWA